MRCGSKCVWIQLIASQDTRPFQKCNKMDCESMWSAELPPLCQEATVIITASLVCQSKCYQSNCQQESEGVPYVAIMSTFTLSWLFEHHSVGGSTVEWQNYWEWWRWQTFQKWSYRAISKANPIFIEIFKGCILLYGHLFIQQPPLIDSVHVC